MKTIKLTLWTEDPENRYSYLIAVDDKDYKKALQIINHANSPHIMPDIRTIQDKYLMSDEIDFVIEALERAGINVLPLKINEEISIVEGAQEKDISDKFLDSLNPKTKKKEKR